MNDIKKRPLLLLILSVILFSALVSLIYFFPPDFQVKLLSLHTPILYVFFLLLFFFFFTASTYTFKNKKHGILIASFILIVLLFRLNNLVHPFFFVLLCGLFLILELLFSYKK